MRTVAILEAFTGYPEGEERAFAAGETPSLPGDYADLLVAKGHAVEVGAQPAIPDATAAAIPAAATIDPATTPTTSEAPVAEKD